MMRRKIMWLAAIVLVGAVTATFLVASGDDAPAAEGDTPVAFDTAETITTDLIETIEFSGTVGRLADDPVVASTDGRVTAIVEDGTTLDDGVTAWEIDGVATPVVVGDAVLYRDLQLGEDPVQVSAVSAGTIAQPVEVGDVVEQGDALYWIGGEPVTVLYGDVPASRRLYWPEPDSTSTTYASDTQDAQTRVDLVDRIEAAEEELDAARTETPSADLLNAIDAYSDVQGTMAIDSPEVTQAYQRVLDAQDADLARIERAEDALVDANQALVDFDALVIAKDRDQAAADASRPVEDNLVGADVRQLETALVAMGYGDDITIDGEFTQATERAVMAWQTDLGVQADGIVDADDIVFLPGPATVIDIADDRTEVAPGAPIATLSGGDHMTGADVALVEGAIGGPEPDDVFDEATQQSVLDWQDATGQDVDGIVSPSDLLVLTEPIEVTELLVDPGDSVRAGEPVLTVASSERFVTFDVPAEDQTSIAVGDAVTITLPDFSETTGVITEISTVGRLTPEGDTIFEATAELDDPSVVAALDEAPVDVEAIESVIRGALAVPVSSLLALAEGGYAVEIADGSATRLVAVDPGFFADGLVEIRSGDLTAGDMVVVP